MFPTYSFKIGILECHLLLDQNAFKEVDSVKTKPLEYEIHPINDGKECVVRFRVKVLSTYYEKSLFIIRVKLWNNAKSQFIQIMSESFKSVSKQTQIQKKIQEIKGFNSKNNGPDNAKIMRGEQPKRGKKGQSLMNYLRLWEILEMNKWYKLSF